MADPRKCIDSADLSKSAEVDKMKRTRKLYYRKDDHTMRFCCAILISVWSSNKDTIQKGRGRCRAETTV